MSNELVHIAGLPAHLTQFAGEKQKYRNDFGELTQQDFGIAFIKLVHGQSKEAMPGWGPNGNEAPLAVGTMFLSRDHMILPIDTPFVPLCRSTTYIKWDGKPGSGKMAFSTTRKDDPRIKAIDGLAFLKDPRTGATNAPLVTTYVNFYCLVKGSDEPVLLSFYRTSTPIGRGLTQDLYKHTKGGTLPLFSTMWKLAQPKVKHDGDQSWMQMSPVFLGYTPEGPVKVALTAYEQACMLRDASTGAEFSTIDDEGGADHTMDAQATVVSTSPAAPAAPPPAALIAPPAPPAPPQTTAAATPQAPVIADSRPPGALW